MNSPVVKSGFHRRLDTTLPALNALRAHLPDARITWWVEEAPWALVASRNEADRKEIVNIRSGMDYQWMDFSGRTDLRELAALYDISTCVVSTDTGPMHLAASMETPVVALFGPTAPWRTGPFGESHQALGSDVSCSPCFKRECDSMACMKDISVSEVFDSIARTLKRSSESSASSMSALSFQH